MKPSRLILVRRSATGGGAESFVRRLASGLESQFGIDFWNAGSEPLKGQRIAGSRGPAWLRAWRFARSVQSILPSVPEAFVLSFERGVPGDVFRLGDGIHREWVRIKYGDSPRRLVNPLHFIYPRLENFSVRATRAIVANSPLVRRQAVSHYPEAVARIHTLENGFDPTRFQPSPMPPDPLGKPVFLFAGSGWERKGLPSAVATIARIPGALLVVCGRGEPSRYRHLLRPSGLENRVRFVGEVSPIHPWLTRAHAFILPTRYDPFSNACLEALASGRPVVTTRMNGITDRIDSRRNGFVIGRDGGAEAVPGWWRQMAPTLDPRAVAATVEDLKSDFETQRWLDLITPLLASHP